MAYVRVTGWPEPDPPFFYNVHNSVGLGSPNRRDDVLLVQYLLHTIYDRPGRPNSPTGGPLRVDGICGPTTDNYIRFFQQSLNARGIQAPIDGRVDRARGNLVGPRTSSQYIITLINFAFRNIRPDDYRNLPEAWDVPGELAMALF